ncbi:MAG: hypothetical protein KJO32_02590, partial [Deltaproteobacteria bacterium]|nr:hypothetical protein [Deltaproteobacteria bacterium]
SCHFVRIEMKKQIRQPNYGPLEYEFDFSFEFKLTFFDYILLGFYVVFAFPLMLLVKLVQLIYLKATTIGQPHRKPAKLKSADHGEYSLISKLF